MQAIADGDGKRLKDRRASGRIAGGTSFGKQRAPSKGPFSVPGLTVALDVERQPLDGRDPHHLAL